ncbi:MAG: hypothetical protein P8075_21145 [Deltaproteobacteria bacterium]|jgi:hypothetical protein
MRKIILVIIALLLVLPFVPRMAYAGTTNFTHEDDRTVNVADSDDAVPDCDISLSRNVSIGYTCAGDDQSYSIVTMHYSGDKEYGTASDTTLIFWQTVATGSNASSPTNANSTSINDTDASWNPL